MEKRKFCDHVFVFRAELNDNYIERTIQTNIDFFDRVGKMYSELSNDPDRIWKRIALAEEEVQNIYFNKEQIEKLKKELCEKIMNTPNPFTIRCTDIDGGYYYEDGELLKDQYPEIKE